MATSTRVLIIGAGASGIAAAARLLENGINNVVILEAENRIGGRVYTKQFGSGLVDLGAQWVHGEKGNIISTMAQPLGLLGETLTEVTDTRFVSSSGALISTDTTQKYLGLLMSILAHSDESLKKFKGSLGEYLTKEYEKSLPNVKRDEVDEPYAKYFLDWFAKFENSIDGSDSWFYTSGPGHTHYWDCDGYLLQAWKTGGFHNIIDLLTKKIPDPTKQLPVESKVQFKKEVVAIEWDNAEADKVLARCSDGTVYTGDYVIVTASLGVLKERAKSIFKPELPAKKLVSIYGLSIGTVDKIYLRFPYQWWPEGSLGFSFIWTEEDEMKFNQTHPSEGSRHWLTDVFGFYEVDHNPNVLCGWVVGPSARVMEKLTDAEVTAGVMELLNRFLGRTYKIPHPDEVLRTTWSLNSNFRGSYSFRSMDSDAVNTYATDLAEPVANSRGKKALLFAGEATHEHFFSTVHGAVESGWREADRVIQMISDQQRVMLPRSSGRSFDVVIVGAGMAGLAAAKTLVDANITDIVVLEAQERAGGRINTVPWNGGWVEAGAQWIHGEQNPVWRLADRHRLLDAHTSSEGEGPYLREDGVEIDNGMVVEVEKVIEDILEDCERFSADDFPESEIPHSMAEHLRKKFNEYLSGCVEDSAEQRRMREELYDWHIRFQVIDNSSNNMDELSAKAWGEYAFCGGKDYVNFKNGYSSLVKKMTEQFPDGVLKLNSPVHKIRWQKNVHKNRSDEKFNCHVLVDYGNGLSVSARHCIVTCSLGYLKEHHTTLFEPSLPASITRAIQDIGFATINKIFLDFQKPWWDADIEGFQLIWSKTSNSSSDPDIWARDLTGFDVLPNRPGVLLGWIGGRGAELVEDVDEEDVGRICARLLRKFTRRSDIPEPSRVLRTQWHRNPYIRGGYGNTTVQCDVSNSRPASLAQPVLGDDEYPVILLAGEATHEKFFSTTHGAFESGERQASVVIKHRDAQARLRAKF